MFSLSPDAIIASLQSGPPEFVWLLLLIVCFSAVLILSRLFGEAGLVAYVVVALLGANIQVLKQVQFSVYDDPVALGTILFASTYLATDILTEHYGRSAARRAVLDRLCLLCAVDRADGADVGLCAADAGTGGRGAGLGVADERRDDGAFHPRDRLSSSPACSPI